MIAAILKLIMGGIWPYIAAGLAAIAGAAGLYIKGRADAKAKRKIQDLQGYAKTRKAIDDAEVHGSDPDAAARWLRERDGNKP